MNTKKAIIYCKWADDVIDNAILFFAPPFIFGAIALIGIKLLDSILLPIVSGSAIILFLGFWWFIQLKRMYLTNKYNLECDALGDYAKVNKNVF